MWKGWKYTFHRGFYSEYQLWILLRWCDCNVIYKHWMRERCRWKCPITNSVLLFVFCGRKTWCKCHSVSDAPSVWRQVFTRPAIHVWYKKFAHGHESVLMRNDLIANDWCNNRSSRFSHTVWLVCDVMFNEFVRCVEKWSVNVWHLNTFACWICSFFSLGATLFNTCEL